MEDIKTTSYMTTAEVCAMLGIQPATLRSWVRQFDSLTPHKTSGGHSRFSQDDVESIKHIKAMLVDKKMSMRSASEELDRLRVRSNDRARYGCSNPEQAIAQLGKVLSVTTDRVAATRIEAVMHWLRRLQ